MRARNTCPGFSRMSIPLLMLLAWLVSAVAMVFAFIGSRRAGKIGYVDVAWAGLMGVSALLVAACADGTRLSRVVVGVLGATWALRLCLYLLKRVAHEVK